MKHRQPGRRGLALLALLLAAACSPAPDGAGRPATETTIEPAALPEALESAEGIPADAAGGVQLNAVTMAQGRLVAVGDRYGNGQRDALVLTSVDGRTWQEAVDPDLGGDGSQMMRSVAATDGMLVAVGQEHDLRAREVTAGRPVPPDYQGGAAVWRSADGRDWQRIRGETLTGRQIGMTDVVATDSGFVAVGTFLHEGTGQAGAWTSTDGLAWRRADVAVSTSTASRMHSVARHGRGLVAVGVGLEERGNEEETGVAAVWVSQDGSSWRQVDGALRAGSGRSIATKVVAAEGKLLAFTTEGTRGTRTMSVWTSTDGEEWTRVGADPPLLEGATSVSDVEVTGTGHVAVGEGERDGLPAAWTSADGGTWRRIQVPAPGTTYVRSVVAGPNGIIAVGVTYDFSASPPILPAFWTGQA